jgi:hypothetical protein
MRKSQPLRVDPVLLREAKKRATAENRTLTEYVETALRQALTRKSRKSANPKLTVSVHPSLRKTIRRFKSAPVPGETKKERAARERLIHDLLDVAGISR